MKKKIIIFGSTGSIGKSLLKIIKKNPNKYDIKLISGNKNYKLLLKQAQKFNIKKIIIKNNSSYKKLKEINNSKQIKIYNNYDCLNKIFYNKEIDYTMCAISGLEGLVPILKIISFTKEIAIANKESIICAWNLINKQLNKFKTKFIPVDSEHFSVWSSINLSNPNINKIYLTASGGPFYKKKFINLKNIKLSEALNHPTWKMGKKISIDSATLMNKIFEIIEAKKIFKLRYNQLKILIHPKSYIHAIIKFETGFIKLIAHDTDMRIPIFNSLHNNLDMKFNSKLININKLNNLNLSTPSSINYPLMKILKKLPNKDSLFETVIVSANDYLVDLFFKKKIKYNQITTLLLKMLNLNDVKKYKLRYPRNLNMILNTKKFTINKLNQLIF